MPLAPRPAHFAPRRHHSNRAPWLRALVLGANDGLVSIASLMMGVGGGTSDLATLRLAGVAGLVGGALSMAVRGVGRAVHACRACLQPGHSHSLACCVCCIPDRLLLLAWCCRIQPCLFASQPWCP